MMNVDQKVPLTSFEPLHELCFTSFEQVFKVARTFTSFLLSTETMPGARINIP